MANKTKNTVEFFPFFVSDGKTLYVMQRKYGLAGVGFFTQIMRWLARIPGHYYEYNEDYDKDRLNEFIGMSESDVKAYITDMVQTGKLDAELWGERGVIYSQDFVDNLEELYKRRKAETPTREWVLEQTAAICTQYVSNMSEGAPQYVEQTRVEESIGEERREDYKAAAPEPGGSLETVAHQVAKPEAVKGEDAELYAWLKARFEKEQPNQRFTDYKKEGKSIKGIIRKARERDPTDPHGFAEGMVESFAELRRRDRKFFGKQPFLPSALNASGIWDRVLSEAYERWKREQAVVAAGWDEEVPF